MEKSLRFSTEPKEMDVDYITEFLSHTYWAKNRNREKVQSTIDASFVLGLFEGDRQIGFARVVTDYETHAYIMDVFIDPKFQRKGLGKMLMEELIQNPRFAKIQNFTLMTKDAGEFYKRLGFEESERRPYTLKNPTKA